MVFAIEKSWENFDKYLNCSVRTWTFELLIAILKAQEDFIAFWWKMKLKFLD